jgi:hypothetical protein
LDSPYQVTRAADSLDQFTKIASWSFNAQYQEVAFTLLAQGYRNAQPLQSWLVQVRSFMSISDAPVSRLVAVPLQSGQPFRDTQFIIFYRNLSGFSTDVELRYRYNINNENLGFVPLLIAMNYAASPVTFFSNQTLLGTGLPPAASTVRCEIVGDGPTVRTYNITGSPYTWTRPNGLQGLMVECIGAGGGGGGTAITDGTQHASGAGGGGGGYARKVFHASELPATCTLTVGAGGTSAAGAAGQAGGATTFAGTGLTSVVANGGGGGALGTATTATVRANGGLGGGATGGDVVAAGSDGGGAMVLTGQRVASGFGGAASTMSGGARSTVGAGATGRNWGGGGSGASTGPNEAAGQPGGTGANGVIILTEYS